MPNYREITVILCLGMDFLGFLENASKAFEDAASSKEQQKELEKLRQENDELAKTLGRTTVERDWAVGKLKSLDL